MAFASGAAFGFRAYEAQRHNQLLGGWEERTAARAGQDTCSSCAVVIPSDKLTGKGFGAAIDAHDCVVRFNAHDAEDASSEDWGTKDDIRVVNAYQVDAFTQDAGSCIDTEHPTCRRVIVTWETASVEQFVGEHEHAEILSYMGSYYFPNNPDVHEVLRNFANENQLPVPMFGSSAYCAISVLRHHDLCGDKLTIFGVPSSAETESSGYADAHGPASAAHSYSTEHEFFRHTAGTPGWENVVVQDMGDEIVAEETPSQ